jgi:8-oxo-dGTP pyrophosphatase MutT (NUDIX family)
LEFEGNLPFVGNWFISERNASVRVAPILPGCDMKKSYYMEVFKGMEAYTQLAQAFSVICSRSSRVVEWDIYGQFKEGELQYQGIVNRQKWDELGQIGRFCFPIVLIMLHADIEGGPKSILQERTIFNASDDIDTFSNISGRVTDMDICTAKALALPPYIDYQDTDDDIATTAFNDRTNMKPGDPLPPGTWEAAAIREIREELGLRVTPDRLKHHCTYHLKRANGDLFFKIFSLKLRRTLNVDELEIIEDSRPYVKLSAFDLPLLRNYHENSRFNRLLQREFEKVFVSIFRELGIE